MFDINFIILATGGEPVNINERTEVRSFSTDSRRIKDKEIFIALEGDNFDGHEFIEEAFDKGASFAIVEKIPNHLAGKPYIRVKSTETALSKLAKNWRNSFKNLKVAAITGSNGKTTTKEMAYSILSVNNTVLKNSGNFNNHIGLPLTLLKLNKDHEICVIELGMSSFGEIRELTSIADPDIGAITNIGRAHLEKLGSVEGVAEAKSELVENFDMNKTFCVNLDDPFIIKIAEKTKSKKIYYGLSSKDSLIKIYDIEQEDFQSIKFNMKIRGERTSIRMRGIGRHNVSNALCAS
ncbi:MAG: UDP-N-acetylmuramoyl-tripeptide--D-alanyl-D-alanine ligase, partial [Thermodesulfobacteriota bacterium]